MKKICFLCPQMNINGGLQRVVTNLANKLVTYGYDITICSIYRTKEEFHFKTDKNIKKDILVNASQKKDSLFRKIIQKIITKYGCQFLSTNFKKKIFFSNKKIKILNDYLKKNKFDCVIASSGMIAMYLCCAEKSGTYISWQHNSYDIYYKTKGKYYFGLENVAKDLYENLDYNIVLTKDDCKKYKQFMNLNSENIYNPLSFSSNKKSQLQNNTILFVGRLEWEQKGLNYLIDILKKFFSRNDTNNFKFIIIGDGTDKGLIKNQVVYNKLDEYVSFTGSIDNVGKYYQNASLLINTSKWEGFGLVITEAMEYGVPAIAFDNSGPSEIISDGIDGFIIPKFNTDVFEKKMYELLNNKEKLEKFSNQALKKASYFQMSKIVKKWIKIIDEE